VCGVLVSKCCLKKHVEFIKYAKQYIFKQPGEAEAAHPSKR